MASSKFTVNRALEQGNLSEERLCGLTESDYWDDVLVVCTEIERQIKDREISEKELHDSISEACNDTKRVIYTRQARVGLCCPNNPGAYPSVEAQMLIALIADVTARLGDIEWPGDETESE